MIAELMGMFSHMDAETKENLTRLMQEAMVSGDIKTFLRTKVARMFQRDTWYYTFLGLRPGASRGDIEAAFKKTLTLVHADRLKGEERFHRMAQEARDLALAEVR